MNERVDPQAAEHVRRTLAAVAETTPRPIAASQSRKVAGRSGREATLVRVAAVVLLLGGVGAVFAVTRLREPAPAASVPSSPPEDVQESLERTVPADAECEVLSAQAERVAVAADPYGGPDYEWWVSPTAGGGLSETVVQVDAVGRVTGGLGGSLACTPIPHADIEWSGGGGGSGPPPVVGHTGHVSVEAATVVLTFPGEEPVEVPVNPDGYFLTILPEHPAGPFSSPERIEALDSSGRVVATLERPSAEGSP